MTEKKITKQYFFSVEGQTENWYLKWLQQVINQEGNALYKVSLNCKSVSPIKRVKQISAIGRTIRITHVFDYEGRELEQRFLHTLEDMKKAEDWASLFIMIWDIVILLLNCGSFCINVNAGDV